MDTVVYVVPGISCSHCEAALIEAVAALLGVESVAVDLEAKRVAVSGDALDDVAIRAAIEEAGYEAS